MKRFLIMFCSAVLILCLGAGGLLAARKAFSMYKNVWDTLDSIAASSESSASQINEAVWEIDSLNTQLQTLSAQVEYLHRQALQSDRRAQTGYDYSWVDQVPPYIAHACGGIDGATYTNSREAFVLNYELGQRVFEVDFNLSDDGVLIASHDEDTWRRMSGSDLPYTSENFNRLPLRGSYASLSCSDVIDLLAAYPDAYVVTDTKDATQNEVMLAFSQLVHCAKNTHPEVLSRIIPQIYNEQMLSWVNAVHPFPSIILTLYQLKWTPESVLNFCMNSGVRFITLPENQIWEDVLRLWDTLDIRVAVHTVNDEEAAEKFLEMGVDMIYTDFITPN